MKIQILKPKVALNKAFLKVKPNRTEIESFKKNLIQLLDSMNDSESEEHHKNLVIDFLKKTYYDPSHFVNTKGRNDLVIHNGEKATSTVGVIIEAKKPTNKGEMVTQEKLNAKAFQELVLYYLRERITHNNIEIKHLIATNINEWFIFDVTTFDRLFAQNKSLVKQFNDFESGRLADTKTDFFYKQIAEPFIAQITQEIEFTYFNIKDYEKPLRNNNPTDDNLLIALFKLLSPQHLLKQSFVNDSNSLDKRFYGELLHIIGLTETKEGSKKLIQRHNEGERNTGSLLENAIIQLDSLDKIQRLPTPSQFGADHQERLFNVGLELSITWINRILFLKLLEAQLINYQKGNKEYEFLSLAKIHDYDDLNSLFFQVLARKQSERNADVKTLFAKVPYLNSSLFEPTDIEHNTLFISNLRDEKTIPIYSQSVLKDDNGKKRTGELSTIKYLFEFLNAYDFASEGSEEIQEDNKTLINASVLGLIFEKINGYKDGSFFTPGFITMYMCRETIRKAVIQKFNEAKGWNCTDINTLYDKIEDKKEANTIINSLKICDPAVGSGHFLVSALNEIIALKSDLKILLDHTTGRTLRDYHVIVENDEIIITDDSGELFKYSPKSPESQSIQETLFHEKQTIIENCLFGVDINPNSVKICRLRLWIELLKNAYYKNETELETLPNIDINIKCGNSLVSRFPLDVDLKEALKKTESKWSIDSYRIAVDTYRNAKNKEQKHEMERLINEIKTNFRSEISHNDPKLKRLKTVKGELFTHTNQGQLFERTKKELAEWSSKTEKFTTELKKLEGEVEEIKNNKIYENGFEWRFEFPEALNDNGDFVGFDVVIGNPPYVDNRGYDKAILNYYFGRFINSFVKSGTGSSMTTKLNLISPFFETSISLTKHNGLIELIFHKNILKTNAYSGIRKYILNQCKIVSINDWGAGQFEDVIAETASLILEKKQEVNDNIKIDTYDKSSLLRTTYQKQTDFIANYDYIFSIDVTVSEKPILNKIELTVNTIKLGNLVSINNGIVTGDDQKYLAKNRINENYKPAVRGREVSRYCKLEPKTFVLYNRSELLRARDENIFLANEKLIMQMINTEFIVTYDNNQIYNLGTTYAITSISDVSIKYILAILNSKLYNFYYKKKFINESSLTNAISTKNLYELPIIRNTSLETKIIAKVEDIFDNHTDINKIVVAQIDQLVYQLYELTPEEIAIIEKA